MPNYLAQAGKAAFKSMFFCAIWVTPMFVSYKVRDVFTRRYGQEKGQGSIHDNYTEENTEPEHTTEPDSAHDMPDRYETPPDTREQAE